MADYIKCAKCRFAQQDNKASQYTLKHCSKCEHRECCKLRATDHICEKQALKWAAIQCVNPDSDYHKALLNVSINGDMQDRITWSGCTCGEACEGSDVQ